MADITIDTDELRSPAIDEVINLQKSLAKADGEFVDDVKTPFFLSPVFYYSVASLLAALAIWAMWEPAIDDAEQRQTIPFLSDYLVFGPVAAAMGLAIGITYGLVNRNFKQMFICGVVGIGVGLGATVITVFPADIGLGIFINIAAHVADQDVVRERLREGLFPLTGVAFFVHVCGRALAWAIISMGAGLGLGVALKSKKLTLNGLAGGMVGGALGGLAFDPVHRMLGTVEDAAVSRAIGFGAVGLLTGLFIGIFENLSKDAWFLMLKGPLSGKQFNIFKSPMVLGSAPKCDIYLFKDPAIEPKHATVTKSGNKYLLADEGGEAGTYVNGRKIDRYILQPGDVVTVGETVLKYHERKRA
jgi:hypothetical protein